MWNKTEALPRIYHTLGLKVSSRVLAYSTEYGHVMATVWISDLGVPVWRNAETGTRINDITHWQEPTKP